MPIGKSLILKREIAIIIATSIAVIPVYSLVVNLVRVGILRDTGNLWMCRGLRSIYENPTAIWLLATCFVIFASVYVIRFSYLILFKKKKPSGLGPRVQNYFPIMRSDLTFILIGSILVSTIAVLLYLPSTKPFPGGDSPFYVLQKEELDHNGPLWSLYSHKRPLVSVLFSFISMIAPKGDYTSGLRVLFTGEVALATFLFSFFSMSLHRRV